jgi:alpha-N-arabinofuranosidase
VSVDGLHDPKHPNARADGLRQDVVDAVAETAPPIIRWPGGCTGTSYEWLDGVGPKDKRPNVIDAHFGYAVGNGFGTAEFVAFCREVGAEPHINLTTGTGDLREALAWLEYSNLDTDTK